MGNSSSSSKVRHKSESMEIRHKKEKPDEFSTKSRSLMELGPRSKKRSIVGIKPSDRPKQPLKETRSGSTVNGLARARSMRKDLAHPISTQGREIILQCFENPHSEFGNKVGKLTSTAITLLSSACYSYTTYSYLTQYFRSASGGVMEGKRERKAKVTENENHSNLWLYSQTTQAAASQ
ncbi:hypothetical protein ANCCAN_24572 [Ancylostoma caninum]|uniref:Uncharacterized protein n=1 Tax=Ancylostoma caninum TaxID=29170 RepID=A0A368FDJ2_ANCCA|nr:hypothetical protein ANCCAN_24572 [Ancylostoma caninum]